jgi:hypothetical protein
VARLHGGDRRPGGLQTRPVDVGDGPILGHHPSVLQHPCCRHELSHTLDAEVVFGITHRLASKALYDLDEGLHEGHLMVADTHEVLVDMAANLVAKPVEDGGTFDLLLVEPLEVAPVELVLEAL